MLNDQGSHGPSWAPCNRAWSPWSAALTQHPNSLPCCPALRQQPNGLDFSPPVHSPLPLYPPPLASEDHLPPGRVPSATRSLGGGEGRAECTGESGPAKLVANAGQVTEARQPPRHLCGHQQGRCAGPQLPPHCCSPARSSQMAGYNVRLADCLMQIFTVNFRTKHRHLMVPTEGRIP